MTTHKTLTFIVPAYNMQDYLERCVTSLVALEHSDDIEVLIVDDGSSDNTADIADRLQEEHEGVVKAIHQPNKGHGGAVNTGIENATGMFLKVVDSDDWVDKDALHTVMVALRAESHKEEPVDLLITDYVYDKVDKINKHTVKFGNILPVGRAITWDEVGHFGVAQYITMHALTYRTEVVRQSKLQLPEHTFYVDFIYSYQPLPFTKRLMYLNTALYHYFIGREGQSVETEAMVRRTDQLLRVNNVMLHATPDRATIPDGLYKYMIHYFAINAVVTSVCLILSRNRDNYRHKQLMWRNMEAYDSEFAKDVRHKLSSRAINLPGKTGRFLVRQGYNVAKSLIGFS